MELPKDLKVIIFDLDGTLHDLAVDWDSVKKKLGLNDRETITAVLESGDRTRINQITVAELESIEGQSLKEDVKHTLGALSKKYELAVFTRNSRRVAEELLKEFPDILIVGREDVNNLKPHPEGIKLTLDNLKITAKQAVLVGDSFHDVEAAHGANIKSIVVKNAKLEYQPKGADYYINHIKDLNKR